MPMKDKRFRLLVLLGMATLVLAVAQLRSQDLKHTSDIAVIVNPENALNDIKLSMLRKVVLGEQTTWANHITINLIVRQEGTPEQDTILRTLAKMSESQFKEYWLTKVFRGEASSEPLTVPSSGLASEFVVSHRGAIAFVRGTDLRKDLKVLRVDGLLPGAPGYALR
jgi:ABC-type phosphate transport system substrate-binding protein